MPTPHVLTKLAILDLEGVPTIDLSELDWVTPAVMAGAAALAKRASNNGQKLALRGPRAENVRRYLARMRFGGILSHLDVDHDVPTSAPARDRHTDLLELSPITCEKDANKLARLVEVNVAHVDAELAGHLFHSLGEVGSNVADHAQAVGYVAAQKLPKHNELRIAVADGGVGLLHWLADTHRAKTHAAALTLALAGVSRHTDLAEAGGGIVRSLHLVKNMSGTALLASGNAWSVDNGTDRKRGISRVPYTGTIFEARIPLAR